MKKSLLLFLAFSFTLFVIAKGEAQIIFFADFEDDSKDAVPNQDVNDVANWKPANAGQIWALAPFANGTQGLKQTVEGCGISGNTPLPGVDGFTNGIIQLEMSWGDNDSWGITFRQSAPDKGYLVVFGGSETPAVIVARLDECGATGKCLDEISCENNAANTLAQAPHGLQINEANGASYLGRVEVKGDNIKVWYLPVADIGNPNDPDLGDPLIEVEDATHKSGGVGVWHESQGNCLVDNVLVMSGGLAVNANGKLTTTWAGIKEQ